MERNGLKNDEISLDAQIILSLIRYYTEDDKLKEFIADESKKYKDPAQFEAWVVSQPKQLEQFNMMILEKIGRAHV